MSIDLRLCFPVLDHPSDSLEVERRSHWKVLIYAVLALALGTSRSFAQAPEAVPSTTPVPEAHMLTPTPAANPSSTPVSEMSSSAPTQETASSPSELKKLSLEQLMNLDVTSVSKQPEPYGEAPAAIDVITTDEIRRSGASTIPEALRLADNLDVAQENSSTWDISARGFNPSGFSDKLLALMDGRTLYTPLLAGVIWNMQDYLLEDIDRIEVISGPGGTLWGSNAVNGVINIISKSAKDTQGLYLEASGGNELEDFFAARYGGTLDLNTYYRVNAKYFDRGPEDFSDGTDAHDSWNRGQGGFRVDSDLSVQDHLTLQGDLFDGDTSTVPGGEGNPTVQGNAIEENLLGHWTRAFSDDSDMSLLAYYDHAHFTAPFPGFPAEPGFPPSGPPYYFPPTAVIPEGSLTDDLTTYNLDFQDRFPLNDWNHVIWGLGYKYTQDVVQNAPVVAFLPSTLDQSLYNAFAQDEIKLGENLSLTVGSKIEHNDFTGYEYEPSGRIKWDLDSGQMLWAAVSRAVRMPSRYDRDLYQPGPGYPFIFQLIGNSNFESEDLIAYELGYRAQITPKIDSSISLFFNNYTNLRSEGSTITLGNPNSLEQLFFQNNLLAQTYGAEFTADYQMLDWWSIHAGYDLLQETTWIKAGQTDVNNGLAETADPKNQVFLRFSMDLPGNMELDPAFRWIDSVQNNNGSTPAVLPSYAELDARLGWKAFQGFEISVVGQNLLHDHHVEAGFPGVSQEEIQRSISGKVSVLF